MLSRDSHCIGLAWNAHLTPSELSVCDSANSKFPSYCRANPSQKDHSNETAETHEFMLILPKTRRNSKTWHLIERIGNWMVSKSRPVRRLINVYEPGAGKAQMVDRPSESTNIFWRA